MDGFEASRNGAAIMISSYAQLRLAPVILSAPPEPADDARAKLWVVLGEGQDQFATLRRVPVAATLIGLLAAANLATVVIAYAHG